MECSAMRDACHLCDGGWTEVGRFSLRRRWGGEVRDALPA